MKKRAKIQIMDLIRAIGIVCVCILLFAESLLAKGEEIDEVEDTRVISGRSVGGLGVVYKTRHFIYDGEYICFATEGQLEDNWINPSEHMQTISVNAQKAYFMQESMAAYVNLEAITFSRECALSLEPITFYGNTKLKEVILPANTQELEGAFLYCSGLNRLDFAGECEKYKIVDGCVVTREEKPRLLFVPADTTEYVVPENIAVIGKFAFANCRKLKKVTLNQGLQEIEDGAFAGCNLKTLGIPESVTKIGTGILINNKNLKSMTVSKRNPVYQGNGKAFWSKKEKKLLAIIAEKGLCRIPDGIRTTDSIFLANPEGIKKIIFPATMKKWTDEVHRYGVKRLSFKGKKPPALLDKEHGRYEYFFLLENGALSFNLAGNYKGQYPNRSDRVILFPKKYKKNYDTWLQEVWGYQDWNPEMKVKMY